MIGFVVGAALGGAAALLTGILFAFHELWSSWRKIRSGVDQTRTRLIKIREGLEKILDNLSKTVQPLRVAQHECDDQHVQATLPAGAIPLTVKDIGDLEGYVRSTYDSFLELQEIIIRP